MISIKEHAFIVFDIIGLDNTFILRKIVNIFIPIMFSICFGYSKELLITNSICFG